eukprot:scaffold33395_cov62-Phaeocystis_antarctica.AAC.3
MDHLIEIALISVYILIRYVYKTYTTSTARGAPRVTPRPDPLGARAPACTRSRTPHTRDPTRPLAPTNCPRASIVREHSRVPFGSIGGKRRRLVEALGHAQGLLDGHLPGIGVFRLRPTSTQAHLHTVLPPCPKRDAWPVDLVEAERDEARGEIDEEPEGEACAHPAARLTRARVE